RTLALECDMEKSNLIRIEKGRTNPTSLTLLKISNVLNVRVKELLDFNY
ncbi:MAG: helix-turn-helix transcriptional regulator, partial [Bacteroidetes bacterium]|nr:helix-turn-helix transcriptional regulator [Bacteroidota bacterium]